MTLLAYRGDPAADGVPPALCGLVDRPAQDAFYTALAGEIEQRFTGALSDVERGMGGAGLRALLRPAIALQLLERYAGVTIADGVLHSLGPTGLQRPLRAADVLPPRVLSRGLDVQSPVDSLGAQGRAQVFTYYWTELYLQEKVNPFGPQVAILVQSLAEMYTNDGNFAVARCLYSTALRVFKRAEPPRPVHRAACTVAYAHLLRCVRACGRASLIPTAAESTAGLSRPASMRAGRLSSTRPWATRFAKVCADRCRFVFCEIGDTHLRCRRGGTVRSSPRLGGVQPRQPGGRRADAARRACVQVVELAR
jgi:hypothetical protein